MNPALRPAQTSGWKCNPSSRLWALCGRHINALTKGRSVTDAGKEGKSGPWMDHPLLPCRQSCGLCDGFLGNSMDAELKEMCSQAAGDTAADFFFFFFCWCCVILGHLLNPSAAVFLCPKRRSDLPHVCVCVCVCVCV